MRVRLSGAARAYLLREAKYLTERSPSAGRAFIKAIQSARERSGNFPEIGVPHPPIKGNRRLIVGDYVIDYEVGCDGIDITTIRHGRQSDQLPPLDDDFDYE